MNILVISPCSATQKHSKLSNKLILEDFQSSNLNHLPQRLKELRDYTEPAGEMYEGKEHRLIREGIQKVKEHNEYGNITIEWKIISTGFGLIDECYEIVPYNVTNKESDILKDGKKLNEDLNKVINNFELTFFLLGGEYVKALQLLQFPFKSTGSVSQIFVTYKRKKSNKGYSNLIPKDLSNCNVVELNSNQYKSGYTAKGFVFKKLCEAACRDGFQVFEEVKQDPQQLLEIVLQ